MQGGKRVLGSFSEPVDLNQASFPGENSTDWDEMVNPDGTRLSNYMLSSNDMCMNASERGRGFSGWDLGQSSSGSLQERASSNEAMRQRGWSPSLGGSYPGNDDWSFSSSNVPYSGNQVSNMQNYGSSRVLLNENGGQSGPGPGTDQPPKYGQSETDHIHTFFDAGTSSGSSEPLLETNNSQGPGPGPSLGTWSLSSSKRKTLEGSSRRLYLGGSSSSSSSSNNHPAENMVHHSFPVSPPGSLSMSSVPVNLSRASNSELGRRTGVSTDRLGSTFFPPRGNFDGRSNVEHHDRNSFSFDTSRGSADVRNPTFFTPHQHSRTVMDTEASMLRSLPPVTSTNLMAPPHLAHGSEARSAQSFPLDGSQIGIASSSSAMLSGEMDYSSGEEVGFRNSLRNNAEYQMFVSVPEARNVPQDQIDWSFVPGTSASSSRNNSSSGSQAGPSTGVRTYPTVLFPHQHMAASNRRRSSETSPWAPFPRSESQSGGRRSHFSRLPSASSSSNEGANNAAAHYHSDQRLALLMGVPGDDINSWRALAEGRHRLIRHVLNSMRRGVHLRAEDMLFDPYLNEIIEMHDRHREMRLDVDNMSYEELLALEERIGNVSTGLSEEKILGTMKQRKFEILRSSPNLEPCCVCQEDYTAGDDIGLLDCGHEFHTNCIKQWLTVKNMCPICKMTGLKT